MHCPDAGVTGRTGRRTIPGNALEQSLSTIFRRLIPLVSMYMQHAPLAFGQFQCAPHVLFEANVVRVIVSIVRLGECADKVCLLASLLENLPALRFSLLESQWRIARYPQVDRTLAGRLYSSHGLKCRESHAVSGNVYQCIGTARIHLHHAIKIEVDATS